MQKDSRKMFRFVLIIFIGYCSLVPCVFSQQFNAGDTFGSGLNYEYYHGTWSSLPNFDLLSPVATGVVSNFDIDARRRDDQFGFRFRGYIQIATAGTYTFFTISDDGSKLYIGEKEVVNNDALHVRRERSGTIELNEGYYPITVDFFENQGAHILEVRYKGPKISKKLIPNEILFRDKKPGEPMPWNNTDIGKVFTAGRASYSNGVFTIDASGADIWGKSDEFHYVYWPLSGNGEAIAKLLSISNTHNWAKAGVMIRETLRPDAKHAFIFVTPTEGVGFQRRVETGKETKHTGASGKTPIYLKIVRGANLFSVYASADSVYWNILGSEEIKMSTNAFVGLAVTSHRDGTLCRAEAQFNLSGAFGEIELMPNPQIIPANGKSISTITSEPLINFYSRTAKAGVAVNVGSDRGQIIASSDINSPTNVRVQTDNRGRISFQLRSDTEPGMATIFAQSVYGDAAGKTSVEFLGDDIKLLSTYSDRDKITLGQEDIKVTLSATNDGQATSEIKEAALVMQNQAGEIINGNYQITRTDTFTQIPPNRTREFSFLVTSRPDADPGVTFIDARVVTNNREYTGVNQKHQWQVQSPPALRILSIDALDDEVLQNQQGLVVKMEVTNSGQAEVNQIDAALSFWYNQQNVNDDYVYQPSSDNPQSIPGSATVILKFFVNVNFNATLGSVELIGSLSAVDVNSGRTYQAENAGVSDVWQVKRAEGILFNPITVSRKYAIRGHPDPWYFVVPIQNRTGADLELDSIRVDFYIETTEVTAEYEINYPRVFSGSETNLIPKEAEDSLRIDVAAVGQTTGFLEITCHIYLKESGQGYVVKASSPRGLGYLFITSRPELQIKATEIDSCYNIIPENKNGIVNANQKFTVKVVIRNISDEDLEDIQISVNEQYGYAQFTAGNVRELAGLAKNSSATLHFGLIAVTDSLPVTEKFIARLEQARGTQSHEQAIKNEPADSVAQVMIQHPARLSIEVNSTPKVRINQLFEVTATVHNPEGYAQCDTNGMLNIIIPTGYKMQQGEANAGFEVGKAVSWFIQAPATAPRFDSIYVWICKKPRDLNTLEYAQIKKISDSVPIETVESVLKISGAAITAPDGAKDDTLSTDQTFNLTVNVVNEMVDNLAVVLELPEGYARLDSSVDAGDIASYNWKLRAPQNPQYQKKEVSIYARGIIHNDTTIIVSEPDTSIELVTLKKAILKVTAAIFEPPKAVDKRITPGLEFKISAKMENSGDVAAVGNRSLILDIPPDHFTVLEELEQSIPGDSVIWTIRASEKLPKTIWIIKVSAGDVPDDVNTNATAYMAESAKAAEIRLTSITSGVGRLELVAKQIPNATPVSVIPGETTSYMGLTLANRATEEEFQVWLNGLKVDVLDQNNNLLFPPRVISGIRVKKQNKVLGEAESINGNPIEIPFAIQDTIAALSMDSVYIEVDLHKQLNLPFKLFLGDTSYINAFSHDSVFVVTEQGNQNGLLNFYSSCAAIAVPDLKQSFCNYPNPFGPTGREQTNFMYYLSHDLDVKFQIYTLIGELVWECSYSANESEGKKGLHLGGDIYWTGKNMKQQEVLNGVYLAVIKTSDGKTATTKVAFIK